jgi:uncharacterized protein with NRDE domain
MIKLLTLGVLLILLVGTTGAVDSNGFSGKNETTNAQTLTQAQNESSYLNLSNKMWGFYNEDLKSSSKALDEYVKKNISSNEAMQAMTSVFMLDYQATSMFARIKPPEKYSEYHNNTVMAIITLQGYILNLAKFYETGNPGYGRTAQALFNQTIMYHDKVIEGGIIKKAP